MKPITEKLLAAINEAQKLATEGGWDFVAEELGMLEAGIIEGDEDED
jgi:hypothetical protein